MRKLRTFAIVLILLGVFLMGYEGKEYFTRQKEAVDLMDLEEEDMKANVNAFVDVYAVWDEVITETTETKTYGVSTSSEESARYYAIPGLYSVEEDGEDRVVAYTDYFVLVKVNKSYFDTMDGIYDDTNEWYDAWWEAYEGDGEYPENPEWVLTLDGQTKKLTDEDISLMHEYLETCGYETDDEYPTLDAYFAPYYLEVYDSTIESVLYLIKLGAGILVAGIVLLIIALIAGKNAKKKNAVNGTYAGQNYNTPSQGFDSQAYNEGTQNITFNNGAYNSEFYPENFNTNDTGNEGTDNNTTF